MDRLKGKRCLVTAAGQGIGRATALALAREGAEVLATDIDAGKLEGLAGDGLGTERLDVRDPGGDRGARRAGWAGSTCCSTAPGWVEYGSILETDEEKWAFSLDLNVTAMYRMMRAFLPGMIDSGGGAIVNIASTTGTITAVPHRFAYGATKAAVIGMTKSVAADFVKQGIRANAICPGVDRDALARGAAAGARRRLRRSPCARSPPPIRWAGSARRRRSRRSPSISPPTSPAFTTGVAYVIDGGCH